MAGQRSIASINSTRQKLSNPNKGRDCLEFQGEIIDTDFQALFPQLLGDQPYECRIKVLEID